MAASRIVELESGTWTGRRHSHNGYYAGDFWTPRDAAGATGQGTHPSAVISSLSPRTGS